MALIFDFNSSSTFLSSLVAYNRNPNKTPMPNLAIAVILAYLLKYSPGKTHVR